MSSLRGRRVITNAWDAIGMRIRISSKRQSHLIQPRLSIFQQAKNFLKSIFLLITLKPLSVSITQSTCQKHRKLITSIYTSPALVLIKAIMGRILARYTREPRIFTIVCQMMQNSHSSVPSHILPLITMKLKSNNRLAKANRKVVVVKNSTSAIGLVTTHLAALSTKTMSRMGDYQRRHARKLLNSMASDAEPSLRILTIASP